MCSSELIDKAPLRDGQGSIAAIGDGSAPEVLNDGSDRQNLTTGDGLSA